MGFRQPRVHPWGEIGVLPGTDDAGSVRWHAGPMAVTAVTSRFTRVLPPRNDLALSAGLLVAAEIEVALAVAENKAVAAAAAVVINGALAWRRRAPTAVAVVSTVAFGVQTAAGVPQNAQVVVLLSLLVAMYSVGAYQPLRRAVAGLLLAITVPAAVLAAENTTPSDGVFAALVVAAPWLAGVLVHRQQSQATAAQTRARLAEAQAAMQAQEAVDAERARIARELHDVVTHNLSAVVVQAAAAEALLAVDPERARVPVQAIQSTGRHALQDMAGLLGLLRADTPGEQLGPQPSLDDIEDLVAQARRAGQDVDLRIEGAPRDLPSGVGLSAYRVVQEALTNARKHAAGATAVVVVSHTREAVRLVVRDNGGGHAGPAGSGHGLVGMRERVTLYGGTLDAGPCDQGWQVSACFPVEPRP